MELERIFCLFPRQENGLLNLRARYNLIKINVKIIHQSQVTEQEINACCFITKALGHFWLKQQQKPSISVSFLPSLGRKCGLPLLMLPTAQLFYRLPSCSQRRRMDFSPIGRWLTSKCGWESDRSSYGKETGIAQFSLLNCFFFFLAKMLRILLLILWLLFCRLQLTVGGMEIFCSCKHINVYRK